MGLAQDIVYVFERETGKPLFPIEYRAVPPSDIEGEVLARTQPLPVRPPAFSRQRFTADMVTKRTPEVHRLVLERFKQIERTAGQFEPPSAKGTIVFPGYDGGGEWGGAGFDPETGLLYVNANEMPWIMRIVAAHPRAQSALAAAAAAGSVRSGVRE